MTKNKQNIQYILDNAQVVKNSEVTVMDSENGIINKDLINLQKIKFLRNSLLYLTDDVVNIEKVGYPQDNKSELELSTDIVVMSAKQFQEIKQYIENE